MKISSPCSESFKSMTPSADGRFCSTCEKVVVDFTKMNTAEIKSYFQNNTTPEVCGRFVSPQVGQGTKIEQFIWNLKERIQGSVKFIPVRVAFVSILTGLTALMSSCMGKVVENYPNEEPKQGNKQTQKVNPEQKTDSIKEIPKN